MQMIDEPIAVFIISNVIKLVQMIPTPQRRVRFTLNPHNLLLRKVENTANLLLGRSGKMNDL